MNFQEKLKENLGITNDIVTKQVTYEFETDVGSFEIKVYPKAKIIDIYLYKTLHDSEKIKSIYQKIERTIKEEITKDEEFKFDLGRDLHFILTHTDKKLKEFVTVNEEYLDQSYEVLNQYGLAMRPVIALQDDRTVKTVRDLLEKTEYEIFSMPHAGEPTVRNIIETLKKLGDKY
jgi:DNA-directed RNA polymerase alpha subunit